jgi:heme/copper-type cytochrome/quinol oxidase subunit 2
MDTNSLIIWSMGVVLIAIGVPLFYLARYLSAPEDKKKQKVRSLKVLAIVWMTVGVLIYLGVFIRLILHN